MTQQGLLPRDKHELANDANDECTIPKGDPSEGQAPIPLHVSSDALDIPGTPAANI